jgi:hypothetical protein
MVERKSDSTVDFLVENSYSLNFRVFEMGDGLNSVTAL